jgi:hypothetical protein
MSAKTRTVIGRVLTLLRGINATFNLTDSPTDRVRLGEPVLPLSYVPAIWITEHSLASTHDGTISSYDRKLSLTLLGVCPADTSDAGERALVGYDFCDDIIAALEADRGLGAGGTDIVHDIIVTETAVESGDEIGLPGFAVCGLHLEINWHAASGEGV